jgi:hypothetical protein
LWIAIEFCQRHQMSVRLDKPLRRIDSGSLGLLYKIKALVSQSEQQHAAFTFSARLEIKINVRTLLPADQ